MKRITILFLSISSMLYFSCGQPAEQGGDGAESEEVIEHHEGDGHDHAQMEEAAANEDLPAAPEGASVFFVNLIDGEIVSSPFKVEMGVEGINVHPAGELIDGTGHHHLIINEGPTPAGVVVPADDTHIHFGGGQTETELDLEPGVYNLTLQFADGLHRSYGESMSVTIEVEVE